MARSQCIVALLLVSAILPGITPAQIRVACVGNSITAGILNTPGEAYPEQLQQLLGPNYVVRNEGNSGKTMLKNGDDPYWNCPQFSDVFAFKPNIITIMLGTNDSKSWNWGPYSAQFPGDYNAMIDTFLTITPAPQIWLALCVPNWASSVVQADTIEYAIVPIIRTIAAQRHLPIIDCNTPLLNHPELFPDATHPNDVGADSIAQYFYRTLFGKPIVRLSDTLKTVPFILGQPRTIQTFAVTAFNSSHGIIPVTGPFTVTKKSPWLTVAVNASNLDSQVITNTVDASSLPNTVAQYFDTVTIHAGSGLAADLTYRVEVWIRSAPALSAVSIEPFGSGVLPSGAPFTFTATALDQYAIPMQPQPAMTWSAAGGSVTQSGLFSAAGSAASGRVIASVQTNPAVSDTVSFTIVTCSRGIAYDYYAHTWLSSVNDIASKTPSQSGTATVISVDPVATTADSFALRFSGYVLMPTSGAYSFYTTSDDGSGLLVDNNPVVENDGPHGPQVDSGSFALGWGLHAITVLYFQEAGGATLTVNWQGPGFAKAAIPDSDLFFASGVTATRHTVAAATVLLCDLDLKITTDGVAVQAAAGQPWTLDLYGLSGARIAHCTGLGSGLARVGALERTRFVIARLTGRRGASMVKRLCR